MKIRFLGTAAFEGTPAMLCDCSVCSYARIHGGRELRSRSQAVIDDTLLIDYPADTYYHAFLGGLDMRKVSNIIVTHSHSDHFYPEDLNHNRFPCAIKENFAPITIYGNEAVVAQANAVYADGGKNVNLQFETVKAFVPFQAGNYTITPLQAVHDRSQNCLLYLIEDGEKRILYGNDTGFFTEEDMAFLKDKPLDLISLDCTQGVHRDGNNHMGYEDVLEMFRRLEENGNVTENTVKVAQHFSHFGQLTYAQYTELFAPYGVVPTYDGLEIEV